MNPLLHEPRASVSGRGDHGVRFTRFVRSGAPGGYSAVEKVHLFATPAERDAYARALKRKHGSRRRDAPVIESFDTEPEPLHLYAVIEEWPVMTMEKFRRIAKDQRQQRARKRRLRKLLNELVAEAFEQKRAEADK